MNEAEERVKRRSLAMDEIVIPHLEKLLETEITIKSFKNLFTIKNEGELHESDCKLLIRYLNEKVAIVHFSDEGIEIDDLIGESPPDLLS